MRFRRIVFIISASLFFIVSCAIAADNRWNSVVNEIEATLSRGSDAYAEGRAGDARASISDAYFNLFEGKGMEAAIGSHISSARVSELESMFGAIRGAIKANAPASDIKERINLLVKALKEDVERLPKKGGDRRDRKESPYTLFFNSFIIIVREGFEAILIISALTAYLVKAGQKDKVRIVYKGAGIAVVASIVTAILLQGVIKISGAGKEALEGITMLFATAVLFYVSYWLITKIEVTRWQHYIKSKIESSLSRGNITLLGFAAFLAVYREGAETILFYQALYASSDGDASAMVAGFASGSLILVGIFALIKYGSVRVPIGPFFAVTSTLLYYLAFTFAGKGILELQEAEWVSSTPVEWIPTIGFLGIYPTWEGVLLQGVLIVLLMVAVVYTFLLRPFREKAMMTKDISHIEADIKALHETLDDVSQHAMICHGLVSGIAGQETEEIGKHLIDIDKKVHEVMDHLATLEKGLEDIFSELERDMKTGVMEK